MAGNTRESDKRLKRYFLSLVYSWALSLIRSLRIYLFFSKNVRSKQEYSGSNSTGKPGILCIFASFSSASRVERYVEHYLQKLHQEGCDIVFVTTSTDITSQDLSTLKRICLTIIHRENRGLDFGSWKAGLLYSGVEWQKYKKILFANDSCYAPLYPMEKILQQEGHGIVSITDSLEQEPHLMSYFLLCHPDVISHPDFLKFWQNVRMVPTRLKGLIVQLYEIGFSRYFRKRGVSLKAVYPVTEIGRELGLTEAELEITNPTHRFWRYLIEAKKCPILKVDLFKRYFKVNNDNSWRQVVSAANYDIRMILEHQGLKK